MRQRRLSLRGSVANYDNAYRIKTLVFEDEGEGLPLVKLGGWRVVEVLDSHRARIAPDKWYLTVLVERV
jgi:hypothetical protein